MSNQRDRSGGLRRLLGGVGRMGGGVALAAALVSGAGPAAAQASLATAVKATYLYKFAPFVTWPAGAFDTPTSPLLLCVVGDDPFGATLDRAVAGQKVLDHPVEVRRMRVAGPRPACHIMYIGGSPQQSVAEALRQVKGAPILTVTDDQGGAAVIDLLIDQGRVRFRVNAAAAADDGLRVSSKLLSLAVSVIPKGAPESTP